MNQNRSSWRVRGSGELYHSADMATTATLTHYGVKGMKWGVRKKIDKVGSASKTKTVKSLSLPNAGAFKNNPNNKNYKPKTSKEYRQEVAANSRKNTYRTSNTSSSVSTTKASTSGGSGSSSQGALDYSQLSEEQLQQLVENGTISKEYAEALLDKKLDKSSAPDNNVEVKGSKEYQQELAYNSQKNSFQNDAKKPYSEVKKTENWKDKVAKGAKAVADTVKKIGKQTANTVSAAAKAAKDWVSKKLNIKKISSTYSAALNTVRGDKTAKLKIPKVSDSAGKRRGVRIKS